MVDRESPADKNGQASAAGSAILVTGGSGFLGQRIVQRAEASQYVVLAPRSKEFDLETGQGVRTRIERQMATDNPIQAVIHSAAYYGGIGICQADPLGLAVRNARMSATIFEEAARAGIPHFVSVGSTCAYPGDLKDQVMTESMIFKGRCHPSVEAYGYSKRLQLVMMAAARKQYGMNCAQIALTNLYGEGDVFQEYRSHAIASIIKKLADAKREDSPAVLWGTGTPRRQFLYVEDAAKAIVEAVRLDHDSEPINVGGDEISIKDLAFTIADMVGLPRNRIRWDTTRPDGVERKCVDERKFQTVLPNMDRTTLYNGLRKTVSWYLENKETADLRE